MTRPSGKVIAAVNTPALWMNCRRCKDECAIESPPDVSPNVARPAAIGQQAHPMFESLAHDGVKRPGTREMTVMLAGLMALNAFAIDAMVPALPAIGRSLHVAQENHLQLAVVVYFVR